MKLSCDLTSPALIHTKGLLFLALGTLAAGLLLTEYTTLKTALLLATAVWAFCRFYYYLFYVFDRYLGRDQRFAGVFDALRYLIGKRPPQSKVTTNGHK